MKPHAALLSLAILVGGCSHKTTYAEGCGAPPAGWITPRQGRSVLSMIYVISVAADGSLSWNGDKVSRNELATYLKQTARLIPAPVTQIKFASAVDCDTVINLRQLMAQTFDCRYGRCAEGSGKWWFVGDVGTHNEPYDPDASRRD